jgi:DNA-binding NtrC family response regulator
MRVGTNSEIEVDVRVLAATNTDPEQALRDGKLRADLYHRLNVFPLHLPPLRSREGDVALLAQHFLDELNRSHGTKKTLSPQVLDELAAHAWPGNVRELRNYVQRAFILADRTLEAAPKSASAPAAAESAGPVVSIPVGTTLADADKQLILATLQQCGGVKTQSAELLGISVKTLYNRLGEYRQQDGGLQGKATGAPRATGNGGTHASEVPDANPGFSRH